MKQLQTTLPGLIGAVQTADSGSFTAAAKVLDLTPAAVSKSVAALEAQLQVRLFNRTTRQLSLTEEGKAFVAQAREGLTSLEAASVAASQGLKPQGLVRLSCSVGFGRRYVVPQLPTLFAAFPGVQIELSLNDQTVDLVREGFDIGIRGGSEPPQGMVARKICSLRSVLVASPAYLKKRGVPRHYSDLVGHDLLRVKFLSGWLPAWHFKDKGKVVTVDAPTGLLISDPEAVMDAAVLGLGIARLASHHAHRGLVSGELVEVLPRQQAGAAINMTMFYPHRAGLAPRVRAVVDFLLTGFVKIPELHT
jgi:DNA-binding transcriptional LysR family regulator